MGINCRSLWRAGSAGVQWGCMLADKIDDDLAKGINQVAIANLLDVSPNTLYGGIKVRRSGSSRAIQDLQRGAG